MNGNSGTGKELAQSIHNASPRHNQPASVGCQLCSHPRLPSGKRIIRL
ncbi:hypothetical protein [Enterocloster sp.]